MGKSILLLSTDSSVEDLSDGKRHIHENVPFPSLDFLVSSVQFSVNKRELLPRFRVSDAPSKLDNAKLSSDDRPKIHEP